MYIRNLLLYLICLIISNLICCWWCTLHCPGNIIFLFTVPWNRKKTLMGQCNLLTGIIHLGFVSTIDWSSLNSYCNTILILINLLYFYNVHDPYMPAIVGASTISFTPNFHTHIHTHTYTNIHKHTHIHTHTLHMFFYVQIGLCMRESWCVRETACIYISCVWERVGVCDRQRVYIYRVCEREWVCARDSVYICIYIVYVWERESESLCERERERERACVC